jgi:hypothetical protein
MRKPIVLCFASLVLLSSAWGRIPPAQHGPIPANQSVELESASGRITAIQGNTFTIETPEPTRLGEQFRRDTTRSLTFTLDQKTTVDGKLRVGARADVTYREQDGNHLAVSVRVSQDRS